MSHRFHIVCSSSKFEWAWNTDYENGIATWCFQDKARQKLPNPTFSDLLNGMKRSVRAKHELQNKIEEMWPKMPQQCARTVAHVSVEALNLVNGGR